MNIGRFFTASEIAECATEALGNWDFDVELENGKSQEWVSSFKDALDIKTEYAQGMWCESGPMDLDSAFGSIWDFLDEFARNIADQSY